MKQRCVFGLLVLGGCLHVPALAPVAATQVTHYRGHVSSIQATLLVSRVETEKGGALSIKARGLIGSDPIAIQITLPDDWEPDPKVRAVKRANVVLSPADQTGDLLGDLVRRSFPRLPSVFSEMGFSVASMGDIRAVHERRFLFEGSLTEQELGGDWWGFLECLACVDLHRGVVKVAFVTVGYGGGPPREVYEWLEKTG